jgi:hypothetical protein
VELLDAGRWRSRVEKWLAHDLAERFEGRILPVDLAVADAWGRIMARATRAGRPAGSVGGFFAATAEAYGLTLATWNVRDFEVLGVALFNPWEAHQSPGTVGRSGSRHGKAGAVPGLRPLHAEGVDRPQVGPPRRR